MVSKVRAGRRVLSNFTPKALLQQLTLEATARYHGTFLRLLGMTGAEPHNQAGAYSANQYSDPYSWAPGIHSRGDPGDR